MKILLTGGAGYIGSHTAIELVQAGHEVVIGDNFSNSKPEVLAKINQIVEKEIEFHEIDFTDKEATFNLCKECNFDAVIHFAGLKAVGESCTMPIEYYRNNIDSTLNIADAMRTYHITNLVFSSSATVYGVPKKLPLKEGMPTSCTNPYGWTKLMNEQILTDIAKSNPQFSIVLLRYLIQ